MNSDEPALVPQWLQKGGPPGTSGGHNYSSTSQFASRDSKTRPKRESTATGGRPSSATARESSFGRATREPPQRDRALRDSWQSSLPLGGSSSSSNSASYNYRPAAVGRSNRGPPERVPSDNSRDSFAPSASSGSSTTGRGVFRTQSGPPLRDREDFGFGSAGGSSSYHDAPALRPGASRGVPLTGRTPPDKPPFDRDFPSLAGRSTASKTWHSGNGPSEQQWTRLADAPDGSALSPRLSNPRVAEPAEPAKPVASKSAATTDVAASQPRMADTLQQATLHSSTPAPSSSKARLEDLAVRQSKQLIPVVSSTSTRDKGKGKGTSLNGPKHTLTMAAAAAAGGGLGGGRGKAGVEGGKRAEEQPAGPVMTGLGPSLRRLSSGDPKPSQAAATVDGKPDGSSDAGDSADGHMSGVTKQPAAKDLERQRTSFFQSLRRTSAKTSDSDKAAAPSSPSTPQAQTTALTNGPLDPPTQPPQTPQTPPATNGIAANEADSASKVNAAGKDESQVTNGHGHDRRHSWDASDPRSKVSAEEEAFLRSLGWTEAGDDEDEGLTEAEIAAFKANTQHLSIKSFRPTSHSFTGFATFSPRPKVANGVQNGVSRPSQLDALSSSDSESDC